MKQILLAVVAWIAFPMATFGWNVVGHMAIAEIATHRLSETARAHVKKLLGDDQLADVALWLDDVRDAKRSGGVLVQDAEAIGFSKKFPRHPRWHYLNLPLDVVAYKSGERYTSSEDIVQVIGRCINVLEGRSSEFTAPQALRILVHLVGDIHQPLHIGTGYYDVSNPKFPKLLTSPKLAENRPHDFGGNRLMYETNSNLHDFWSVHALQNIGKGDYLKAAGAIEASREDIRPTEGDYHAWAAIWAVETLGVAREAYQQVVFQEASLNTDGTIRSITVRLPLNYQVSNEKVAARQVLRGGVRLAELLNMIQWP